jgi:hypothetical protein
VTLPYYFDQHAPGPVASGLRTQGIDVLTAEQDGHKGIADELIFERATLLGRIMVTNDSDFLAIATRWRRSGRHFAGLAYYPDQNTPHGTLIESLMLIAVVYPAEEMIDRIEYLPL